MTPATPAPSSWLVRRLFPILGTIGLVAAGMIGTIWGPRYYGKTAWALPDDLWGTLIAAQRLLHLNLGGLYTVPTQLVSLPGAAVILVPCAALIDVAGVALREPKALGPYPAAWLIAGPYQMAISAVALFAADALAERLGARRLNRFVLAAASATALWSVTARWGHPEDAVATGLLLYAIVALADAKPGRAGWLAGAAVAVQPLVLLALPVLLVVIAARRWPGFLARAALPSAALLAAAAAANWSATISAVTSQPNSPSIDHPTPWIYLAPHLTRGQVAAGPFRIAAIVVACGCALLAARRWRAYPPAVPWPAQLLQELLWWTALALALRSVFEPVMVAYYLWPPLAVALIAAASSWPRLLFAGVAATLLTFFSQIGWRNPWAWWLPMIALLGLTLFLAWRQGTSSGPVSSPQVLPEPGEQFVADGAP